MRGSIAIWHDTFPIDADGYAPRVEVHVNIWRNNQRKKRKHFDLLDIGFRFEELRALRSLSISFPFVIKPEHVSDLFEVMHDTSTLSAIFNDTLTPGSMLDRGNCFAASHTESKGVQFFVWRCPDKELQFSTIGEGRDRSTVITISDQFFEQVRPRVGDHYFRLRIEVPIDMENGFVSSNDPKDSAFLSTISTSEIVEFRLNERRNFSNAIRNRLQAKNCGLIDISAVHYFLIRDMGVEMTRSHTAFRKMRRLEPRLWERYLTDCSGFNPDKMIIYHWASFAPSATAAVESFSALATFRADYTGSLLAYGAVIVALGAMGSAVQSVWATAIGENWPSYGSLRANVLLLVLLALGLAVLVCFRLRKT
ncbi:hypothetical protein A1351_00655 [Methylosinus sp. R-45379]|uniref:hypothetical protein n=1 Tax=Methylosinus sp. R-45379 TaxID=980563 RepID=UPI0007C95D36|nr:hypothetical protein [Methylosinus sp. R-45379]OAI30875.1 hypothetical protein A1351_00655 [Methylosinus sp. R-45379]